MVTRINQFRYEILIKAYLSRSLAYFIYKANLIDKSCMHVHLLIRPRVLGASLTDQYKELSFRSLNQNRLILESLIKRDRRVN